MRGPDMISETDRLKRTSRLCIVDMIGWVLLGDHNLARLLLLLSLLLLLLPSLGSLRSLRRSFRSVIA